MLLTSLEDFARESGVYASLLRILEMSDQSILSAEDLPAPSYPYLPPILSRLVDVPDSKRSSVVDGNSAADEFHVLVVARDVSLQVWSPVVLLHIVAVDTAPTLVSLLRRFDARVCRANLLFASGRVTELRSTRAGRLAIGGRRARGGA